MKTVHTLEAENKQLRKILRDFAALDPANIDPEELRRLQEHSSETLRSQDQRVRGAAFTHPEVQGRSAIQARAKRSEFLTQHGETIRTLKDAGRSYAATAEELNRLGIPAPKGGLWKAGSVKAQYDALLENSQA